MGLGSAAFMLLIIGTVQSQGPGVPTLYGDSPLTCPGEAGGNYLGGDKCYWVFSGDQKRTWYHARDVCESHGMHLVVFKDQEESNQVGRLVNPDPHFTNPPTYEEFWIGVHCPGKNCTTGAFDSYGNEVSHNQASWADGEPVFSDGQCFFTSKNKEQYAYDKPYVQSACDCSVKRAFVCEKPAVPQNSFMCFNHGFTDAGNVCNGRQDCVDGSDEINCGSTNPNLCHYHYKAESGQFSLPSSQLETNYQNSKTCTWAIETPLGTNCFINFTRFDTEREADIVQVYVGSIIEINAVPVASLSGQLNTNSREYEYRSPNNMMFIKFSSDSIVSGTGFSVNFGSVKQPYEVTRLMATNTPNVHSAPLYEVGGVRSFLGMADYEFLIEASTPYQIVTVEIQDMLLGDDDKIHFYDGETPLKPRLLTVCNTCPHYKVITSTGKYMLIHLSTNKPVESRFVFRYKQGCDVVLTKNYGMLFSPGYVGGIYYPNNVQCSWRIDADEPISLYFEHDLQLVDDHKCIENSNDYLRIYKGLNHNGVALHTGEGFRTSELAGKVFQSDSNGQIYISFKTSPTANQRGFMAYWSKDCVNPNYDSYTIIDSGNTQVAPYHFKASMTLTCALGYGFHQQQFAPLSAPTLSVTLTCDYKGEWNYRYIPRCTPNYCGDVPPISNGYIAYSTGSEYGDMASYECYPGSQLISQVGQPGNNNITCLSGSSWQPAPRCQTASCSMALIVLNIANGQGRIRDNTGDGSTIGSIIDYECNDGFQISGDPILICTNNGQWSATYPSCIRKTCLVPSIENGAVSPSTLVINYDSVASVTCNTGYTFEDPAITSMRCMADRTMNQMPKCIDENECNRQFPPCEHQCKNLEGSYFCSCNPGYEPLASDPDRCTDINECTSGTHACDQGCSNIPGGYTCSCTLPHILYTSSGLSGYFIPPSEDGLNDLDTYKLNKSCVLISCAAPPAVNNARLLTGRTYHRYGDTIEYRCEQGYRPQFASSLIRECDINGDWTGTSPTCIPATCPDDYNSFPTPQNPATYSSAVSYSYGTTLDLYCSKGSQNFTQNRQCVYNRNNEVYELQGSSYECGVIDCGQPERIPGSLYTVLNTIYPTSFEFACTSGNQPSGSSISTGTDYTVRCGEDGHWIFGSLQCYSQACPDPGYPAGGRMIATSLADQSVVTFACIKQGYTLSHNRPLTCTGTSWNDVVPSCIDTTKPTIQLSSRQGTQPCDGTYVVRVRKYESIDLRDIAVSYSDNDRIMSFQVEPRNVNTTLKVENDMTVRYTAVDYSLNQASCEIQIRIIDEEPPTIQCPPQSSLTVYIDEEDATATLQITENMFTVNDNFGRANLQPVQISAQLPATFTFANMYQTTLFRGSVRDQAGNAATCQGQVFVTRHSCTPNSFPTPLNAVKVCTPLSVFGGGWSCTITCNARYTFEDDGGNGKTRTVSCQNGGNWDAAFISSCVEDRTYPVVTCPTSTTIYFASEDDSQFVDYSNLAYTVSDLNTITRRTFTPETSHNFTVADLYQTREITMSVEDNAGLVSPCKFQYIVKPQIGSPLAYPDILFGSKSCVRTFSGLGVPTGYQCTITCNPGYVLRDYGISTVVNSLTGFDWDEIIPACVPDTIRPVVSCPSSKTLRLQHANDNITVTFGATDFLDFSSSDAGGIATSTFSPAAYTFTTANLYTAVPITLTVVDNNNNAASCSFSVRTMPAVCSELSLPRPTNGQRVCTDTFNGWQCTLTCNQGYSFSHTIGDSVSVSCTDGIGWTGYVPGCSLDSDTVPTVYFAEVEYRYQPITGKFNVSTDCLNYYESQQSRLIQTQSGTSVTLHEAMANKMVQGCYTYADVPINVDIDITFLPEYFETSLANIGTVSVPQFRQIVIVYTFTMTISDSTQSENCKNWFFDNMARARNSFEFAKNITGNGANCDTLSWDHTMEVLSNGSRCLGNRFISLSDPGLCRRCPPGSVSNSVTCSVCPIGQYHGDNDQIQCSSCPSGTTTRYPGATSANDCIIPCRAGQFSDDGYQPCSSAPVGYYTDNGLTLTQCPFGQTTTTVGSNSIDACVNITVQTEPCGAGTQFDGSNCQLCDLGFYRTTLQSTCQACPLFGTTTYIRGAISESSCYGGCGGGLTSTNGLAPCTACPRGTYYVNSTYCESCGLGLTTRFVGSLGPQQCISEALFRVNCPRGKYRNVTTGDCIPCAIGTYSSTEESTQCASCPAGSSTYQTGATSSSMCFTMCQSGTTSTTGLSPCTPCGFGFYAVNPTTCQQCPTGTMTKTNYASIASECIPECSAGSYSVSGYNFDNSCRLCPANFYQDQTGQTSCKQCGPAQYTSIGQTGATSSAACLNTAFDDLCVGRCNQGVGGVCSIENHTYNCTCPAGYYGANCENVVDYCENNPCFNNGQCQNSHNGPICNCGNIAYGDRCENVNETCTPDYCENGGYCLNMPGYQQCLCTEGYSGTRCASQQSICPLNPADNPCQNGGVCEDTSFGKNLRRKCNCRTGWTGDTCEIMIDLCESTPCLYGAVCTPRLNDYTCQCPSGYTGKNCELRQDRCQNYDCNGGQCVDDYMSDQPRCLCAPGFVYGTIHQYNIQLDVTYSPLPAQPERTGVSVQDCEARCSLDSTCKSFSLNVAQGNCYIWRNLQGLTVTQTFGYNHYTKETIAQVTDDYWTDWYDVSRPTNSNGNDDTELRSDLINNYGINVCEGSEPIGVECREVVSGNPVSSLSGTTCTIEGLQCNGFTPCPNYEVRYKCGVHRVFSNNRCERLDACLSNPCPARRSSGCRTVNDNYECICAEGYTGRSCQINIDDCERLQCQNGGVCVDRLNGIDCDCTNAIGYTGTLCEIRLNYCDGKTCSGHGRCENLLTNYKCVCNVGWEGRDCETLTDTCLGNPCLHGGNCVQPLNTVNFYQCQCAEGWTGTNCEQIVDYCAIGGQSTCRAQCYSIFSDYYCKCPANVYGRDCENTPNPCGNYDKCLSQNGGVCSYDAVTAAMTCTCTDQRYTGEGCHILVDHCSANSNNCQNGGTCHIQPTGYRCECPEGYNGLHCENEINECLGVTCPGGGACFDDIGHYYCRCPLTKTGANCLRDYDPNYDICFNHPEGLSYAWVPFPNQVVDGDLMSVTLWVRFTEPGSTGTYFNMFVGDRLETSFKFMDFSHDGVRIYISTDGGITPYTLLPFSFTHAVTDGNWHSIVLNYNLAEGRIALIKNSIKMTLPDFVSPELIIADRTFKFWSVIGCEFNQMTKSCVAGNIFHGCVSQVNFYDRNIDFNTEINALLTEPRKVYDPFVNVLLVWNEYLLESSSGRIIQSEANRLPCPGRCRTYSALSRPTLSSSKPCPGDQYRNSTERLTKVFWDEPAFEGAVNLIRPEYQSGASYHWGTYQITYIAEGASGEKAFCSFKLYVQSSQCETPQRPLNGNEPTCEIDPAGYKGCSLSCFGNSLIDRVTPKRFTCDRTGSWNVEKRFNRFMFPPCGDVSTIAPRDSLLMAVSYEIGTIACQDAEIDFKARTRQAFKDLNSRTFPVGEICGDTDCTDLTINVLCGQTGLQEQVVAILEVTIPDCIHRTTVEGISMLTSEFITCSVLGPARILNFNDTIPLASIEDPTYSITPTRICPSGRVLINNLCVECGAGTFWYKPSADAMAYCESCPRGQYQGSTGQMSCESCGNGLTTEMMGATGFDMCKAICKKGEYYDLTAEVCRDCPIGFYQDEDGQFFCKFCLRGYTTKAEGSKTIAACQETCQSGEELSDVGCVPCARGYYRDEQESRTCLPCPAGKITVDVGATSSTQCTVEACEAGYRLDVDTNTCIQCEIGYYQDEKWQTSCKLCGNLDNWRTDMIGSADPQDCKFFCSDGFEAKDINTPNPYCQICDIGYYKNNLISYYSQCTACPGNYRTKSQGSVSAQNCTIYKCPAGQQPNAANNGCEMCPLGYYQPLAAEEACRKCPGNFSTRNTGSTSEASCENYCVPGEEKQASGRCVQCLQGFYKDNDLGLFSMCMACPENYTTLTVGASKAAQCSIRDCRAGYKRNDDDTDCIACPQGTYQENPHKDFCVNCTLNQSTRTVAATSPSQCEVYCNPGQQKTALGCEPCPRGYYKSNVPDVFSMCMMCPIDTITPSLGSDDVSDCYQGNCTEGYRLNIVTNNCELCPKGTYQDKWWQEDCEQCGPDRTTENVGATSADLCILSCPPGTEDIGGECQPCPRGTYKTQFLAAACTACPQGFTTETTGADTPTLCTLPACAAGFYLDRTASPVDCKKCDYDQYQDQIWQESCKACPGSLVTLWTASTSLTDCITDCASGSEYNFNTNVCDTCPRGYYRDKNDRLQYECQICDLNFITASAGATSSAACNVRNCTLPGYYLNEMSNQCLQCPRGTYLNQKWQTRCTDCPNDYSTLDVGSTSINDCRRTCPLGQYVTNTNECRDCPIGTYRSASSGEQCEQCPDRLLTPTTGATSDAQCTNSPCDKGEYYIRNQLRCERCARGTYQDQMHKFQCIDCPYAIKYTPQTGADSLALCESPCTSGQQMNPVTLTCEACPVGYYQETNNQFVCTKCPFGREYTAGTGSTSFSDCKDICEAGNDCSVNANCISGSSGYTCQCFDNYVDVNNNGRNCQACPAGEYYRSGFNRCDRCPSGEYQPNPGMASCLPCAAGTISTAGRLVCAECGAGRYSTSGSSVCLPCAAGQYQPNAGEGSCLSCPEGTQVNGDKTACLQCPAGTYATGTAGDCQACPAGQYQPNTGQGACLTCPQGTEPNNARTLCLTCPPGQYSAVAANGCQFCPAGQYQPDSGQTTCLSCVDSDSNADRTACINLCDLGYCLNGGTCDVGPPVTCTCGEWYTGNKCQFRKDSINVAERNVENIVIPVAISVAALLLIIIAIAVACFVCLSVAEKNVENIVIPVAISVAALLLIIIAIAVACFVCLRKSPSKAVQYSEFAGDRTEKVSVHSYGNTPYNFTANRMMLQPGSEVIIDNPAYTGSAAGGDPAVYTA